MSALDFATIINAKLALEESFLHKNDEDNEEFKYIMELIREEIKSEKGNTKVMFDGIISHINLRHLLFLGYSITKGGTISW